ncbi:MAG TPA: gliding motility-associated C-terminal domain-containing protein, partial [Aequorivita sp.]|nr:gliding motility-associated C-terminal domain-containing protein [Aequorivita sp.]
MKKLILLLILSCPIFVSAQNIDVFRQFNGRYDFTAVGNTLSTGENNTGVCNMLTQSSATLALGPGETIISAQLYWASIGTGDFDVAVNGTP